MKMVFVNPDTGEVVDSIDIVENPSQQEKDALKAKIKEHLANGESYRYEGEEE
jgi:hypothetical protein